MARAGRWWGWGTRQGAAVDRVGNKKATTGVVAPVTADRRSQGN